MVQYRPILEDHKWVIPPCTRMHGGLNDVIKHPILLLKEIAAPRNKVPVFSGKCGIYYVYLLVQSLSLFGSSIGSSNIRSCQCLVIRSGGQARHEET